MRYSLNWIANWHIDNARMDRKSSTRHDTKYALYHERAGRNPFVELIERSAQCNIWRRNENALTVAFEMIN